MSGFLGEFKIRILNPKKLLLWRRYLFDTFDRLIFQPHAVWSKIPFCRLLNILYSTQKVLWRPEEWANYFKSTMSLFNPRALCGHAHVIFTEGPKGCIRLVYPGTFQSFQYTFWYSPIIQHVLYLKRVVHTLYVAGSSKK